MADDEDERLTELLVAKSPDKKGITYDYDVILNQLKRLGKYQLLLVAFAFSVSLTNGMNDVGPVFLLAVPPYRCLIPGVDGQPNFTNYTEEYLLNLSTPQTETGHDGCKLYDYNYTSCSDSSFDCLNTTTRPKTIHCDSYIYDGSEVGRTAVTEWDLICDRLILGTTANAAFFAGSFIGCFVGGNVSDYIGRRYMLLITNLGILIFGFVCAFSPSLVMFGTTRFLIALIGGNSFATAFVFIMEIVPSASRSKIGLIYQSFYAIGYILLSPMGYLCKDWKKLQLAISLMPLPFLIQWVFMPESPRWLFSKGKNLAGQRASELIAKRNSQKLPEDIWKRAEKKVEYGSDQYYSAITPFRRPLMRYITLVCIFCWFTCSLTYYGLSLNIGSFAGDLYVNNALGGLADVLATFVSIFVIDRFGRKKSMSTSFFIAGVTCIVATFANYYSHKMSGLGTAATILALCGKLAISTSFNIIYNFVAELFPTVVRGTVMGIASTMSVFATLLTPYALYLQYSVPWLPGVIFGVMSLLAGIATLRLPETKDHVLMTTLEEAEEFYRRK